MKKKGVEIRNEQINHRNSKKTKPFFKLTCFRIREFLLKVIFEMFVWGEGGPSGRLTLISSRNGG